MSSNQHTEYTGGQVNGDIREVVKTVTIHREVTAIEKNAFYGCANLTTVTIPNTTPLKSIEENAFYFCRRLQSIKVPSSVTTIEKYAFAICS